MDNISSFLKYKEQRDTIKPMYQYINMLSSLFRRMNFKMELELLTELFENFEVFVKELEKNEWDQKKVSKETKNNLNKIIDTLNYRATIRRLEQGV